MREFVYVSNQITILTLSNIDVEFIRNTIIIAQIISYRLSYINTILIQSREQSANSNYLQYYNSYINLRSFSKCRATLDYFKKAYSNYKQRDYKTIYFLKITKITIITNYHATIEDLDLRERIIIRILSESYLIRSRKRGDC